MSVPTLLLGLLEGRPAHGYTLKQRYDASFARVKPLPFGQVYASLSRLERDGLAEVVEVEVGEGPERRVFAITPAGVASYEHWLLEPFEPTTFAVSVLYSKVTLALLSGRSSADILDAQRSVHLTRMRALNSQRREAEGSELLAVTYELAHLDADLRWIEESGHRLEQGGR
jgi:DNA-binding PadR family transcriptional regulator